MRPSVNTDERPLVLVWELTQACDLACKHCRADATPDPHPDELSTAEGKRLLEEIATFGDDQLVVLSGGDPLIRDDALELIEHGVDHGLQMTVTPSGTGSLTPERVETLADLGVRRLALSFDGGEAATHDEFRQEPGSFDQTLAAARAAVGAGLPLQINTTVCAETVGSLPAVRDLVGDLDAVLWSVFFLVPVGRGRTLESLSPAAAESVMHWLAAVSADASFGVKTTEAPQFRRVRAQRQDAAEPAQGRGSGIIAGDGFAFVSHLGHVYPSGFLPFPAGSVRESSVVDLYRSSPLFRQLRDRDALRGKCGACEYRHLCGGSRSRAFASTGDPLESDPLCPYRPAGYESDLPAPGLDGPG